MNFTVRSLQAGSLAELEAAVYLGPGAILIDEYDNQIMDDVRRVSVPWNRIDKRLAPGEQTGGFDQSAVSAGRVAPRRNLGFTPTYATRVQRPPRTVKAIVADTQFGIFDRSVYQQQGRRFGDLTAKDVTDLGTGCVRKWASLFYNGNSGSVTDEFDGLNVILGAGTTVAAASSIFNAITDTVVSMSNSPDTVVMPTAVYTNARIIYLLNQELLKIGDKLLYAEVKVGDSIYNTAMIATPVGFLPLIPDPFNSVVAGTPAVYPTYIVSEDKLSWQYVEVLGAPGADPKTYEITPTNALDLQYKCLMFGALEILGSANHHKRLNIQDRTTPVAPA